MARWRKDPRMNTAAQVMANVAAAKEETRRAARRAGYTSVNAFLLEQEREAHKEARLHLRVQQPALRPLKKAVDDTLAFAVVNYTRNKKAGLL